jgi:hypothetical protein
VGALLPHHREAQVQPESFLRSFGGVLDEDLIERFARDARCSELTERLGERAKVYLQQRFEQGEAGSVTLDASVEKAATVVIKKLSDHDRSPPVKELYQKHFACLEGAQKNPRAMPPLIR